MNTLTYTKLSDSVLAINLHNGYTVIAMKLFDFKRKVYRVTFYLKNNDVDTLELMEKQENIEFAGDKKSINSIILKHIANLLREDFYEYYINRYDYMIKCFEKGNELFEKERLNSGNNNSLQNTGKR